jgi:hypothetical protein
MKEHALNLSKDLKDKDIVHKAWRNHELTNHVYIIGKI